MELRWPEFTTDFDQSRFFLPKYGPLKLGVWVDVICIEPENRKLKLSKQFQDILNFCHILSATAMKTTWPLHNSMTCGSLSHDPLDVEIKFSPTARNGRDIPDTVAKLPSRPSSQAVNQGSQVRGDHQESKTQKLAPPKLTLPQLTER